MPTNPSDALPAEFDPVRSPTLLARTQYLDSDGRRLAYRTIGEGRPLVLCTRFRGTMDLWDPAFLDRLATNGFQVVIFDYTGLGRSSGTPNYSPPALAKDANDLIEALHLRSVVIGGWSLGGLAAQVVLAKYPQRLTHAVLLGTTPPSTTVKPAEQLFYDLAHKPVNDLEDEIALFFEPRSDHARAAARQSANRIAQRDRESAAPAVPKDFAIAYLGDKPRVPAFPADAVLAALKATDIPVLHIGGDHDIIFPVENWYALNQQLPTLRLLTFPRAGHGPHHQYPQEAADHIAAFVRHTRRG